MHECMYHFLFVFVPSIVYVWIISYGESTFHTYFLFTISIASHSSFHSHYDSAVMSLFIVHDVWIQIKWISDKLLSIIKHIPAQFLILD